MAKTTVYRRYDSREDLIADAIAEALAVDTPPEVDDTREALRNILFPSPPDEPGFVARAGATDRRHLRARGRPPSLRRAHARTGGRA